MEHLATSAIQITGDGKEEFYSNSKCSGCGICEKVCLSNKIKLINKRPEWQKNDSPFMPVLIVAQNNQFKLNQIN